MPKLQVVAIDGPSGSGKSTVARRLAERLGWVHIDTGAMYRAIGLQAARAGVALDDDASLAALCARTRVEVGQRRRDGLVEVRLDGEDVSLAIREHRVSELASRVSARAPVREAMVHLQRRLGSSSPAVLEGRDIGTVVFPDAFLKIYLTAADEVRAARRAAELRGRGQPAEVAAILDDIRKRDAADSSRRHAPLRAAADAVTVDTTRLSVEAVVDHIAGLVADRLGEP